MILPLNFISMQKFTPISINERKLTGVFCRSYVLTSCHVVIKLFLTALAAPPGQHFQGVVKHG